MKQITTKQLEFALEGVKPLLVNKSGRDQKIITAIYNLMGALKGCECTISGEQLHDYIEQVQIL